MGSNDSAGALLWLRRDLRLADHPALAAALARGGPIWPVYIYDDVAEQESGAAARWRIGQSLRALDQDIRARGGKLILRRGDALETLRALAEETGAGAVYWSRLYTPGAMARDKRVKAALREDGREAESFAGSSLMEPWALETKTGGAYRVFTPFWRALRGAYSAPEPLAAPDASPNAWPTGAATPESLSHEALALGREMRRGADVLARFSSAGEAAAEARLSAFLEDRLERYKTDRDFLDRDGVSGLSPHLACGEISPHRIWRATRAAMLALPETETGGWHFLSELAWRDFAWSLGYHTPELFERNWRADWDAFPWRADNPDADYWRRGLTGEPLVDAAMRELYVTGVMHNRARMLVASYLTKHLMTDWRLGAEWFRDTLVDYDPASNAMGWQWTAGSGPDAAPYFRIYNPETQAEKFDPKGAYRARWLPQSTAQTLALEAEAEAEANTDAAPQDGLLFYAACPRSWGLAPDDPAPTKRIDLAAGRQRALAAYDQLKQAQ